MPALLLFLLVSQTLLAWNGAAGNGALPESPATPDFSGNGGVVGLCNFELILCRNTSYATYTKVAGYSPSPPHAPYYTYSDTRTGAYGMQAGYRNSWIGMYLSGHESKIILGELEGIDLGYGYLSSTNPDIRQNYLLNSGHNWFTINYELGFGFMTNFKPQRQFGINFICVRGSLDRSYSNNSGRTSSYARFKYRYRRLLGELTLEGQSFGFQGLTHTDTYALGLKYLRKRSDTGAFMTAYIGLNYERRKYTVHNTINSGSEGVSNISAVAGFNF